jgi:hypothetical protein
MEGYQAFYRARVLLLGLQQFSTSQIRAQHASAVLTHRQAHLQTEDGPAMSGTDLSLQCLT